MRIVCPSCSAAYDVPDSLVTAGRIVRCARCGDEWIPVQTQPEPPPAAVVISEPPAAATEVPPRGLSAMDRLARDPAPSPSRLSLRLAWAASVVLLVGLGWAAYAWRAPIMTAWPPSERAYAVFGMQHTR